MSNTAWTKVINKVACANQDSIYSAPVDVEKLEQFGVKCVIEEGTGDVDVSYEIIESNKSHPDDVLAEVAAGKLAWTAPVNQATILQNVTSSKADGFSPMVTRWVRFKATGNAGNGADCKLSLKLSVFHRSN